MAPTVRAQVIDEGVVTRVYLEQPSLQRRMTVIWSTTPQKRQTAIRALGATAQLMDRFGNIHPLEVAEDNHVHVTLQPASANTVPGFPDAYFIGGEAQMLLEPLPDDYTPFPPTYANLPEPGQS
jgi:hypothetical protein